MNLPKQTGGIERNRGGVSTDAAVGAGQGILPQHRVLWTRKALCYYRCVHAGHPDLICRFFCGVRPFTIGGLLITR
jgi:hypothetical protein